MNELDDYLKIKILRYLHPVKHLILISTLEPHLFTIKWKNVPFIKNEYHAWYRILQRYGFGYILTIIPPYACRKCDEFDWHKLRFINIYPICDRCMDGDDFVRHLITTRTQEVQNLLYREREYFYDFFDGDITYPISGKSYDNEHAPYINDLLRKYIHGHSECIPNIMRYGVEADTLDDIFVAIKWNPPFR
jgi:hypothetical protein